MRAVFTLITVFFGVHSVSAEVYLSVPDDWHDIEIERHRMTASEVNQVVQEASETLGELCRQQNIEARENGLLGCSGSNCLTTGAFSERGARLEVTLSYEHRWSVQEFHFFVKYTPKSRERSAICYHPSFMPAIRNLKSQLNQWKFS